MIFLSHNKKDKPIVEPIAIRLSTIFGANNVFYDSWSIQPGDGIIDKMNEGLEKVKFFLLFISTNSLSSNMVKLEWQNALMKATHGKCKIIPIRVDGSLIPAILMQTLYLDLYTNGIEVVLKQILDVIGGNSTFNPKYAHFSNVEALIETRETIRVTFQAKHFMEPTSMYAICVKNTKDEVSYRVISDNVVEIGFNENIHISNGETYNAIYIHALRATTPQNPVIVDLIPKNNAKIQVEMVLKGENNHDFHSIPIKYH
ncbi:MAG: toll/interleukin-1 receptor domain-containing protein [Clostridia bacterium]|nr:toll/interleukin-1 receptor domain-containing protein [Clostridia bacterium]